MAEIEIMSQVEISFSVVSHGQMSLVMTLLQDMAGCCQSLKFEVILTLNIPEVLPGGIADLPFRVLVLHNEKPLGFGENHNRAFWHTKSPYFCVINPDIRLRSNIFPTLIDGLKDRSFGVIAPLIVGEGGEIEDSVRKFPTPFKIICKVFGGCKGQDYKIGLTLLEPDWVGGMLMVFRREVYDFMGGFDQKYFLYYEDVDFCARIWLSGRRVVMNPLVQATHIARRSSHTDFSYSKFHVQSMLKFFLSPVFFRVILRRLLNA